MRRLTKKEETIMKHFWKNGELFVRELRELYEEPKPHFNTLSTQVRTLENNEFLNHNAYGPTYRYFPTITEKQYYDSVLNAIVDKCFNKSYLSVVSAFVKEEKVSIDELKELISRMEKE